MKTRAIETQQSEHDSLTKLEDVELVMDKESTKNKILVENNVSEIGKNESEKMNGINKSSNDEKDQQEDVTKNNKKAESNNDENNNNVNHNVKGVEGLEPTKPLHGILSTSKNRMGNGRMESPVNDHPVPASASDEEPGKKTLTVTHNYWVNKRFPRAVAEIFELCYH